MGIRLTATVSIRGFPPSGGTAAGLTGRAFARTG
jgi:hypothetical protein